MMPARFIQVLLAGLVIGLLPLRAVHGQESAGDDLPPELDASALGDDSLPPASTALVAGGDGGVVILPYAVGGDGGVVILPSLNNVLALAQTLSSGHGESNHVSVPVSLAGDFDMFRFKLPDHVANPLVAVAYIDKYLMAWSVPIVDNYLEIEREPLSALEDLGVKHLEVLVLTDGAVFGFCIEIEETEKTEEAEKTRKGKKAQTTKAQTTKAQTKKAQTKKAR